MGGLRLVVLAALCPGCSWLLDFSSSQIPKDAAIDAPYTADECAYKEPNDTVATAAPVTPSDMGPAAICPTSDAGTMDLDYYSFAVPAGTTSVTVSISFTDALGDLDLDLDMADGTPITHSRGFGDGESITCPAQQPPCPSLAAGTYVFEVYPGEQGATNSYTFTLALQ
ncbi:MAG TPA: pre-peptidase C-terminal domain-containing protein [Kofleriaceae bacterium]|nr:pre-peptidase C-terminal domain-containing protein [Kofleriaceae bacterium]